MPHSIFLIRVDNQRTVLVLADVDVLQLVPCRAQLGVEPNAVLFDEFEDVLIQLSVEDERIACVLLAVLNNGELSVRLEHSAFHVFDVVNARHAEFQRDVMREHSVPHTLIHEDFAALDQDGGTAVDEVLDRTAVHLEIFQNQHEQCPRDQHKQEVQNGDGVVVDHAANDAAENIVLHLIGRGVRREVALAEQVDLEDETQKAKRELAQHQRVGQHVSPPCPQSSRRGSGDASAHTGTR